MTVFACAARVLAVIDMENRNLLLSNHFVELCHNPRKIIDNIISCIVDMTGIKAYSEFIIIFDPLINGCQFFKISSYLAAFSGHGLQSNIHRCLRCEHGIQAFNNTPDACFFTGSHMGPGMQNQYFASHGSCPFNLFGKKFYSQFVGLRLYCIGQIDDVRRMNHNFIHAIGLHQLPAFCHTEFFYLFAPCILGRTCIYHQCICAVRQCFLH